MEKSEGGRKSGRWPPEVAAFGLTTAAFGRQPRRRTEGTPVRSGGVHFAAPEALWMRVVMPKMSLRSGSTDHHCVWRDPALYI